MVLRYVLPSRPLPFPSSDFPGSQEDVELAVRAAQKVYEMWSKLPGDVRARHMYSIARHVQKPARCAEVTGSAGRYQKKIQSQYIETSNVRISRYIDVSSGINQPKLIGFHGN